MVKMGRTGEASVEYLEALKQADSMIVPEDYADEIRQLYEPLIEAQAADTDETNQLRLCKNVQELLVRVHRRQSEEEAQAEGSTIPDYARVVVSMHR